MGSVKIGVPGFATIHASGGNSHAITGTGNYVLPVGWYYIKTDASCKLQVITTGTTWTDHAYGAASKTFGPIYSDGTNMRILSTSGGGATVLLYPF